MKKQKNEKPNRRIKAFLLLLLYAGIFLLFFPVFRNLLLVEKTTTATITEVKNLSEISSVPFERIDAPTMSEILGSKNALNSIGGLQIPDLALGLPIFAGINQEQSLYGVLSMYPDRSPEKQNLVLIGHHFGVSDVLFGKLQELKVGQKVYLRYLGKYAAYKVTENRVINEDETEVLEDTVKPKLTLITCDRITQTEKRILVTAVPLPTNDQKQLKKTVETAVKKQQKRKWVVQLQHIWLPLMGIGLLLIGLTILIIKKV